MALPWAESSLSFRDVKTPAFFERWYKVPLGGGVHPSQKRAHFCLKLRCLLLLPFPGGGHLPHRTTHRVAGGVEGSRHGVDFVFRVAVQRLLKI